VDAFGGNLSAMRIVQMNLKPAAIVLAAALLLVACSAKVESGRPGGAAAGKAPEAGFVVLQSSTVPVKLELPGRTTAFETSEVRPQVSGIIQARLFTEGAMVKAGEELYRIDPRVYAAALDQARADLASALATSNANRMRAERSGELAKTGVVSKQDLLDTQATAESAAAAVERARAGVATAELNLQFTRVKAPISGRIGRSIVTSGALVTAGQATPLATIQRLDPIFVDIQQSSATLLAVRRQTADGGLARASTEVNLMLEDGSRYPQVGVLQFAESMVDASTGTVTVRARFPNPQGLLLPGMFVRAEFAPVQAPDAILVPQQAISRDAQGNATALVIGADSKAELRQVVAERTSGQDWVVSKGLQPGDQLIVEGLGRIQSGQAVRPVDVTAATVTATATGTK
jgi:membrane fusion protein (multidrug efflux system)